jgi:hypothetical protein
MRRVHPATSGYKCDTFHAHPYDLDPFTNQDCPPQHSRIQRLAPATDLFPPALNVSLLIHNLHSKHTHLQLVMPRLFVKLESCLFALRNLVSGRERFVSRTKMSLP